MSEAAEPSVMHDRRRLAKLVAAHQTQRGKHSGQIDGSRVGPASFPWAGYWHLAALHQILAVLRIPPPVHVLCLRLRGLDRDFPEPPCLSATRGSRRGIHA